MISLYNDSLCWERGVTPHFVLIRKQHPHLDFIHYIIHQIYYISVFKTKLMVSMKIHSWP